MYNQKNLPNKRKKFRISAKNIFLIYENVDIQITEENILSSLKNTLKKYTFKYIIYKKIHENNTISFNVILLNNTKFYIYTKKNINVNIYKKIYTAKHLPIKNLPNLVYTFCKNANYITNIENISENTFLSNNSFSIKTNEKKTANLNLDNLEFAYVVGLIEGDGYFCTNKNRKSVTYRFGIELHVRDLELLHFIRNILQIKVHTIRIRERKSKDNTSHISKTTSFDIRNKDLLKNNVFPVFDTYPMLTNKIYDYLYVRKNVVFNIISLQNIEKYVRPIIPLNTIETIVKKPYFNAWLIGFIEAEACFCIIYNKQRNMYTAKFEITQKNGKIILESIKKYINLNANVFMETKKKDFFRFAISSVHDISKIIHFIQNAPVKLKGYKKIQYLEWLQKLHTLQRYNKKIVLPTTY